MVTVTIDGKNHQFPKGTVLVEACNQVGAEVPFFCYHAGCHRRPSAGSAWST
jgi:NADH dehydrogenase/NADH:ubiquinone oxidoreductase subunit G